MLDSTQEMVYNYMCLGHTLSLAQNAVFLFLDSLTNRNYPNKSRACAVLRLRCAFGLDNQSTGAALAFYQTKRPTLMLGGVSGPLERSAISMCSTDDVILNQNDSPVNPQSIKQCTKCGKVKALIEFYKSKATKDGKTSACKTCSKKQARLYQQTRRGKELHKISTRKSRQRKREKRYKELGIPRDLWGKRLTIKGTRKQKKRAIDAVSTAIATGKLFHPSFLQCASPNCSDIAVEYHHYSYDEKDFLSVIPLCKPCHIRIHMGVQLDIHYSFEALHCLAPNIIEILKERRNGGNSDLS